MDEVIVKFKGRVIFRQYISKKRKCFGIKIYKLYDESGYTYDMRVYLGGDSHSATDNMTATHAAVRHLTCTVEGLRHKIFMDNFFSSQRLFNDLDRCKINLCGTVRPNRKDIPSDFGPKQQKLKRGDIRVSRGGLAALVRKDRQEIYILTNMDPPPTEGNFCDNSNCPVKPHILEWCNRHMGYGDSSDCMADSYSMSRHTFKWTTKLFFLLLDLTVLNSWILLSSFGAEYTHRDFRLLLVRNLIEEAGKSQDRLTPRLVGRPSSAAQMFRDSIVFIINTDQRNLPLIFAAVCVLLAAKESAHSYKYARCHVGLCVVPCFEEYHRKLNL